MNPCSGNRTNIQHPLDLREPVLSKCLKTDQAYWTFALTVRDECGRLSLKMLLLSNLLTKFIQRGTLRVFDSGGKLHVFGNKAPGPTVTLRLHDRALEVKLALNPELYAGEAYMDGTLTFEEGTDVGDLMGPQQQDIVVVAAIPVYQRIRSTDLET